MEETLLINVKVDAGEALKNLTAQKEAVRILREETKAIEKEQAFWRDAKKQDTEVYKANSITIVENEAKIKNLTSQMGANQKIVMQATNATQGETGAYQRLVQVYAVAAQKAKDLGAAYGINSTKAKEAATAANKLKVELTGIEKAAGQSFRVIGEYERGIGGVSTAMGALPGPIGNAVTSFKTLSKSMWAVVATPIGAILTAIALVVMTLVKAFKSNGEAVEKFSQALAPLKTLLNVVLNVLGKVTGVIIDGVMAFGRFATSILNVIPGMNKLSDATQTQINLEKERQKLAEENRQEIVNDAKDEEKIADLKVKLTRRDLYTKTELLTFATEADRLYKEMATDDINRAEKTYKNKLAQYESEGKAYKDLTTEQKDELRQMEAAQYTIRKEAKEATRRINSQFSKLELEIEAEKKKAIEAGIASREKAEADALANRLKRQQDEVKSMSTQLSISKIRQADLEEAKLIDDKYYAQRLEDIKAFAEDEFKIIDKEKEYGIISVGDASLKKYEIQREYNSDVADLASKRIDILVTEIQQELDLKNIADETILAGDELTNSQRHQLGLDRIERDRIAQVAEQEYRLKTEPANAREINKQIEIINDEANLNKKISTEKYLQEEKNIISNAEITNLQNKLASINEHATQALSLQKSLLNQQMAVEIAAAEKSGAAVFLIEAKYAKLKADLDKQKRDNAIQALSDMFGGIAGLFGENTKIAKMAASAQIAVDTYKGATAAYTAMQGMPLGLGIPLGIAAAAVVTASGLANIKKVWATKSGLPGDSGGGGATISASVPQSVSQASASQAGTVSMSASTKVATQQQTQDITSQVAAGVSQALQANPLQPTLVVSDVTTAITNKTVLKSDNSL